LSSPPTKTELSEAEERFDRKGVLLIAAAHTVQDTFQGFLPPLLPLFIGTMALTNARAGLLALFLDLPSLLQPIFGHATDRGRLKALIYLSPGITAVMMSLLGIAPNYTALVVLLLMAGISRAVFHASGPAAVGHLSGRRLGHGMGMWMIGGQLGPSLGPLLVVGVVQLLGVRRLPWLMLPGILVSLLLFWQLRTMPTLPSRSNSSHAPMKQSLMTMAPLMLIVTALVATRAFLTSALSIYLPTFLTERGAALWVAGASLSMTHLAGTVGVVFSGGLSDRFGRRTMLSIAYLCGPVLMLLFLASTGWAQVVILFFLGLTALSTMSVLMAVVQESFPANRSLANGLYLATTFVVQSAIAVAVGAIGDHVGLGRAFAGSALVMLCGLPLVRMLPNSATRSPSPIAP